MLDLYGDLEVMVVVVVVGIWSSIAAGAIFFFHDLGTVWGGVGGREEKEWKEDRKMGILIEGEKYNKRFIYLEEDTQGRRKLFTYKCHEHLYFNPISAEFEPVQDFPSIVVGLHRREVTRILQN